MWPDRRLARAVRRLAEQARKSLPEKKRKAEASELIDKMRQKVGLEK